MIEEIFYFFQFFIKLTKRRNLMKKFLLSTIIFCCLGTTSCFSVRLSTNPDDLSGVLARIILSDNTSITDEEGKVWKLADKAEVHYIPINSMRDIEITEGGDPASVDVGGSITFMLTIPQDETRSHEATRYLHFTRLH